MILQNKTSQFQKIKEQVVRPFRTIIVDDNTDFNENDFEIIYKHKAKKIKKVKKNKGD